MLLRLALRFFSASMPSRLSWPSLRKRRYREPQRCGCGCDAPIELGIAELAEIAVSRFPVFMPFTALAHFLPDFREHLPCVPETVFIHRLARHGIEPAHP